MRKIVFFLIFILLFSFAGCKEKECEVDYDCFKKGFTAKCIDNVCHYTPIIGQCGNTLCERGENKCNCPADCGVCSGSVPGSQYLVQTCINDECLSDVPKSKISPMAFNKEIKLMGDVFGVDIFYNQPFNIKKDTLKLNVLLKSQSLNNKDVFIKDVEVSAKTLDRRTIILGRKEVNKPVWKAGDKIDEEIILDFQTNKIEEELKDLNIVVNYNYVYKGLRTEIKKTGIIKVPLTGIKFIYVAPDVLYPCPATCNDYNPATKDYCDPKNHFCMHKPVPDVCGNFICETDENKCTCPADCGPCEGSVGEYLTLKCEENECVAKLKEIVVQQKSVLDERSIGAIKLINNYNYNVPFDVNKDKFVLKFSAYTMPAGVSDFKIDTVRVLSGTEELGKADPSKAVTAEEASVEVGVKSIPGFEQEDSVSLKIWYSFKKDGRDQKGSYSKTIGKVNFINPK